MQPGKSPLTGPLWVIAIGILILGIGIFYIADVQRQRTKDANAELETVRTEIEQRKLALTNPKVTVPIPPSANPSRATIIAPPTPTPSPTIIPPPPPTPTPLPEAPPPPTIPMGAPSRQAALAAQGSATVGRLAGTDTGLHGRVKLLGTPPPEKPLPLDPACGKLHSGAPPTTRFYVTGADNGLADVLVYVKSGLEGKTFTVPDDSLLIDQRGCEYLPYVSAVLVGQTILVRNSDPLLHNVHPTPAVAGNPERNLAQLPKGPDLKFAFQQPELFLRFKCDVHPWMFSYVSILPHPFFAVTDANGEFHLPELPPGKYVIEAMHRKAGTVTVEIEFPRQRSVNFQLNVPPQ